MRYDAVSFCENVYALSWEGKTITIPGAKKLCAIVPTEGNRGHICPK